MRICNLVWCMAALSIGATAASGEPNERTVALNSETFSSFSLQEDDVTETTETTTVSDGPSYLISSEPLFGDLSLGWPGLLTGMGSQGFHKTFAQPMGNPMYFESPFIETNLRLFYLWHDFSNASQLAGGQANVVAAQARIALTDRLAFIATKDGYTWLETGITPKAEGWNDVAVGLKYALIVDETNEFVLTSGLRWEWHNGHRDILMGGDGGDNELSPFVTVAKGWGMFNFIGDLVYRVPMDRHDGNHIIQWDLHVDCEIAPDVLPGFFPLLEVHALHYLTNGDQLPLGVGGLDYSNVGSSDVAGTSVFWGDLGFRWKLTPNFTFGASYGFPISSPENDLFNQRVMVDLIFSF